MTDESKAGTTIVGEPASANTVSKPEGTMDMSKYVLKEQLEEVERDLKDKAERNAEVEKFLDDVSPLMEKLESQPELTKAILDGKITPELVKAVSEGKVSIKEAEAVTEAHKEVKKELGSDYKDLSPEKIEKMVETKLSEALAKTEGKVEKTLSEERQLRELENKLSSFIAETPDFADFAQAIDAWFDAHPNQTDIEVAYDAVKGRALREAEKKAGTAKAGEAAKEVALNAAGGGSMNSGNMSQKDLVDSLISGKSNPNLI